MSDKYRLNEAGRERHRRMRLAILERIGIERYVTVQTQGTDPATWWPSGVKPGQLPYVGFNDGSLLVDDENGLTVYGYDGVTRCIRLDGWVELSGARIRRVEIFDSTQIVDYVIVPVHGTTSHTITFKGGGVCGYVLDGGGRLIELTHRDVLFLPMATDTLTVAGSCSPSMRFRREGRPHSPS